MRKAAAEAIKALAIALGPGLDSPSPAAQPESSLSASKGAAEALEKCRFDKVKPVRDAVQEAQAVLLDLEVSSESTRCTLSSVCTIKSMPCYCGQASTLTQCYLATDVV